jgi:alpha-methylacyl-CoA racemase
MGPLDGLRIIELASIGPGPMCGMLLADLGAEVIRIDRLESNVFGSSTEPRFDVNGRGRRSVAVNIKSPIGRDVVMRLIDKADVLIEGLRPGVAERLGLGPENCQQRNGRLVYGRMTGFGQTGPLAQAAGHDLNYVALSGALDAIGTADGGPTPPLNLVGDYGGGALYLALGIMSALFERQRSGLGQVVDAAMVDGAASLMSAFYGWAASGLWSNVRGTNLLDGGAPFYATYQAADGKYVAVAALEPQFFKELCERLALDVNFTTRQHDREIWPEMRAAISTAIATKTRDEWSALLEGTDACFAPVLSIEEAPRHQHAVTRKAFVDIDGVVQPAPAPRFSRSQTELPRRAPGIGSDTHAVLYDAGFSAEEILDMQKAKVIMQN